MFNEDNLLNSLLSADEDTELLNIPFAINQTISQVFSFGDYEQVERYFFQNQTTMSPYELGYFLHEFKKKFPEGSGLFHHLIIRLWELLADPTVRWEFNNISYLFSALGRHNINLNDCFIHQNETIYYRDIVNKLAEKAVSLVNFFCLDNQKAIETISFIFTIFAKWHLCLEDFISQQYKYGNLIIPLLQKLQFLLEVSSPKSKIYAVNIFSALSRWNFKAKKYDFFKIDCLNLFNKLADILVLDFKHQKINDIRISLILNAIAQLDNFDENKTRALLNKCIEWLEINIDTIRSSVLISSLWSFLVLFQIKRIGADPAKSAIGNKLTQKINAIIAKKNITGEAQEKIPPKPIFVKQLSEISIFIPVIRIKECFTAPQLEKAYRELEKAGSVKSKTEILVMEKLSTILDFPKISSYFNRQSCHNCDGALIKYNVAIENDGYSHFWVDSDEETIQTRWRNGCQKNTGWKVYSVSKLHSVEQVAEQIKLFIQNKNTKAGVKAAKHTKSFNSKNIFLLLRHEDEQNKSEIKADSGKVTLNQNLRQKSNAPEIKSPAPAKKTPKQQKENELLERTGWRAAKEREKLEQKSLSYCQKSMLLINQEDHKKENDYEQAPPPPVIENK